MLIAEVVGGLWLMFRAIDLPMPADVQNPKVSAL
jgi:hypothetical protein